MRALCVLASFINQYDTKVQNTLDFDADRSGDDKEHLYEVRVGVKRPNSGWRKPAVLLLWYHPEGSQFDLVGVEHLY
ncbi:MAG: hypothetical protein WBP29_01555 [Candidatus Zixiibacteriota bacterium]